MNSKKKRLPKDQTHLINYLLHLLSSMSGRDNILTTMGLILSNGSLKTLIEKDGQFGCVITNIQRNKLHSTKLAILLVDSFKDLMLLSNLLNFLLLQWLFLNMVITSIFMEFGYLEALSFLLNSWIGMILTTTLGIKLM